MFHYHRLQNPVLQITLHHFLWPRMHILNIAPFILSHCCSICSWGELSPDSPCRERTHGHTRTHTRRGRVITHMLVTHINHISPGVNGDVWEYLQMFENSFQPLETSHSDSYPLSFYFSLALFTFLSSIILLVSCLFVRSPFPPPSLSCLRWFEMCCS